MLTILSNRPVSSAVVHAEDFDPGAGLAQSSLEAAYVPVLLVADRRRGDARAVARRGPHGESAPAAPDFQDVVARTQRERPADPIHLPGLGRFEGISGRFEVAAGVHEQHRVEKQTEEVVPEVVVAVHVPAAAGDRVVAQAAGERAGKGLQPRREAGAAVEHPAVAEHETAEGDQVGARPVAVHIGLADADVGADQRAAEETLVAYRENGVDVRGPAEPVRPVGAFETQRASLEPFEPRKHGRSRPAIHHRIGSVTAAAPAAHGASCPISPLRVGLGTRGTPFHQSLSACQ